MNGQVLMKKLRGAAVYLSLALLSSLLFIGAAVRLPAQQAKPNIANDVEGNSNRGRSRGEASGNSRSSDARGPARRPQPPRPPALLDVTFSTGVGQDEIFVQSGGKLKSIGKTSADGRLSVKMQRGVYNITASRAGERIQRQQVDIRPGNTTFMINLTGQPLTHAATHGATPNAKPGTNANASTNIPAPTIPAMTVEDVLRRFQDPKRTDSVTEGDWQAVLSQTNLAFAQDPTDMRVKAQTLFARGQLAYLHGDYANALVAFNNSALTLPGSAIAYYGLGNAYLATNQLAEAVRAYQRAIELSGGMAMAYKGIGDALDRQGRSKEALAYYERARTFGYASSSASMSAALNQIKLKHWSEALKELTEISRSHPSAEVFILMGDCYVKLEQPLSAAPAYRRASELNPKSAVAYAKYGEVMLDAREYAAAMEALERALVLDALGSDINRARTRKLANEAARKARKMK